MNPDKQNALISEALGLHTISYVKSSWNPSTGMPEENVLVITDKNGKKSHIWTEHIHASLTDNDFIHPKNYAECLDDMHEALKYLKDNYTSQDFQKARFINHLENIVSSEVPNSGWSFALTTATAAQKAEAFLKTIGKWEE